MDILTSVVQEGKQLRLICTVRHMQEEAEGITVFLCKDKSWDCLPETSLEQLRLKWEPGTEGVSTSSQLVFTITQTSPQHSGTYQCCARSQKPEIRLQGHFFSVSVTGELLMPQCQRVGQKQGDSWRQKWSFRFRAWSGH